MGTQDLSKPKPTAARERFSVLLVDGDPVACRFAEQAFEDAQISLELVHGAQEAIEILDQELFDVVIAETSFADMSGMQLLHRLRHQSRTAGVPFLFWTTDARMDTRIGVYMAGAEIIAKPTNPAELVARTQSLIERHRREMRARTVRPYLLAGQFDALPLPDLISMMSLSQRTGTLSILADGRPGSLVFRSGQLTNAEFGNLKGMGAFVRAVAAPAGQFEFDGNLRDIPVDPELAGSPTNHLLLEAARLFDTATRDKDGQSVSTEDLVGSFGFGEFPSGDVTAVDVTVPAAVEQKQEPIARLGSLRPTMAIARALAGVVQSPMTLGELELIPRSELATWSRSTETQERLLVLIVGDLESIVAQMVSVCSPPGEQVVTAGMRSEIKFPTVSFVMRGSRSLHVIGVEQSRLDDLEAVLGCKPGIALIVARGGNTLSVGTHARVRLGFSLSRLEPRIIAGIGDADMRKLLVGIRAVFRSPVQTQHVSGALGTETTTLRAVLGEVLLAWGKSDSAVGRTPWDTI